MIWESYKFLARQGLIALSRGLTYARCFEWPTVVDKLQLRPDDRLLDVGPRFEVFMPVVAMKYGCSVWGVDLEPEFSKRQLKMASKVPKTKKLVDEGRLNFIDGDAAALPIEDGFFTKISAISTVEHIPDESPIVRELARVLAPGGRLVMTVPYDPWRDEPKYYRKNIYGKGDRPTEEFYERYYNDKNLRDRLIEPSGLAVAEIDYFGEPGFNAYNLVFGNERIPWPLRRIFFQPFAPLMSRIFTRKMKPSEFRHKTRMYTADTAVVVLEKQSPQGPEPVSR